jgi:NAD(P) transhydrogenase subunit alpha
MRLGIWSETTAGEKRVALVPETAKKLVKAGVEVLVQKGAGAASFFEDHQYEEAGAKLVDGLQALASEAEFIFAVQPPSAEQVVQMKEGSILLASLLPMKNHDVVKQLKDRKITAFSTDAIPRTTRAQSMDTLSSMANIAGYKACNHRRRPFSQVLPDVHDRGRHGVRRQGLHHRCRCGRLTGDRDGPPPGCDGAGD